MKSYLPGLGTEDVDITEFHTPQRYRRVQLYLRIFRWYIPIGKATVKPL